MNKPDNCPLCDSPLKEKGVSYTCYDFNCGYRWSGWYEDLYLVDATGKACIWLTNWLEANKYDIEILDSKFGWKIVYRQNSVMKIDKNTAKKIKTILALL